MLAVQARALARLVMTTMGAWVVVELAGLSTATATAAAAAVSEARWGTATLVQATAHLISYACMLMGQPAAAYRRPVAMVTTAARSNLSRAATTRGASAAAASGSTWSTASPMLTLW